MSVTLFVSTMFIKRYN